MLNSAVLCTRITTPARAERHVLRVTRECWDWAVSLKTAGLADKTITRIVADALLAGMDHFLRSSDLTDADSGVIVDKAAALEGVALVKANISLPATEWVNIESLAEKGGWTSSQVVRVVSHIAMEQAYNELSGR